MPWQLTVYAVPTVLATLVSVVLAAYTLQTIRRRQSSLLILSFFGLTLAVVIWTGFSALKLLTTDPGQKLFFYRLLHVGAAALPPLFCVFALAYTERGRWLRDDVVGALFVFPVVFLVLLFVNPWDLVVRGVELDSTGLVTIRVVDGPGFLLFVLFSSVLTVLALALIVFETIRVGSPYYPQAAWLGLGAIVPIVFGALNSSGVPPFSSGMNLVPTSGTVSAIAFGFVTFRYRLFDLPPLAYTTAMRQSPDGMFVLDADERIVHTNPSGQAILDTVDRAVGDSITAIFPTFEPETATTETFELAEEESQTYFDALVEPLTRGGQPVGWSVVLRDVTEQHEHQKVLQQQAAQLDEFASMVSHDLRNPLSIAQGYLEIAQENADDSSLDRIESAHDRIEEIISNVLALSRLGEQIGPTSSVLLSDIAERSWANVDTESATLALVGETTIEADETMLQHVFENLFRNAIEHGSSDTQTDEGRSAVDVRVGTLEDGFFVEDSGPGIAPDLRDSVLEPGFTTTATGNGYGLRIVKSVVEAHGWSVAITESTSGGARFEITGLTSVSVSPP